MIFLREITEKILNEKDLLLYIHTPFCATCHIARSFVEQIEGAINREVFYEMNASFYPDFMEEERIKNVPCLYIRRNGEAKEKIYTFHSVANIVHVLANYAPEIFEQNK